MGFHRSISFTKSTLRIIGAMTGIYFANLQGIILFLDFFILAEILGIIEEIKEK